MPPPLPTILRKIIVPPIKCQGIKTKLVEFIAKRIRWDGAGRWVEPFLGSGVVLFNLRPVRAVVADSNPHIINFYSRLQSGQLDEAQILARLQDLGAQLARSGEEFYYHVREQFNATGDSILFLFLNRSCFNGLIRFNNKGQFNVPFGHKPQRFAKAYLTKIFNQVRHARELLEHSDWQFRVADWQDTLAQARAGDFCYLDPPYIGRHTDYFNRWGEAEAAQLATVAQQLPCGYALSMWQANCYRENPHIAQLWSGNEIATQSHFYHLGATEALRNSMDEALVVKPGYLAKNPEPPRRPSQPTFLGETP